MARTFKDYPVAFLPPAADQSVAAGVAEFAAAFQIATASPFEIGAPPATLRAALDSPIPWALLLGAPGKTKAS